MILLAIEPKGWSPNEPLCEEFALMDPEHAQAKLVSLIDRCHEVFLVATGQAERKIISADPGMLSGLINPGLRKLNGGRR